ncbi:MAG TPA: hypothetical protein VF763_07785 [Candidatus Limnocylindrales bacterium]
MTGSSSVQRRIDPVEAVLRTTGIALALGTAYIHSTLGGLLFTLNAVGFATFAVALVAPIGLVVPGRFAEPLRVLVRLGLLGFAAATVAGWIAFGARFDLGYYATAIEVAIVVVMALDLERAVGSPMAVARSVLRLVPSAARPAVRA